MNKLKLSGIILIWLVSLVLGGCAIELDTSGAYNGNPPITDTVQVTEIPDAQIDEAKRYSTPDEVAAYINEYGRLPSNFITKKEASALGWKSNEGNLWDVTDQMSIGGDTFGNREGRLPSADNRKWYECDVNYEGGYRGAERVVYSNDGLIYYTDDHYETFEQLY